MKEDYKGRTYRQLVFIYWLTLLVLVGFGIYCLRTGTNTGGTLYWRYGGSTSVTYGGYGFFIMAGVLLIGRFFIFPKRSK